MLNSVIYIKNKMIDIDSRNIYFGIPNIQLLKTNGKYFPYSESCIKFPEKTKLIIESIHANMAFLRIFIKI